MREARKALRASAADSGGIGAPVAAFSLVHAMWTWPLIFVLSCFLGYAYERTGNLWTCIVIHAAFNGFSTLVYLTLFH